MVGKTTTGAIEAIWFATDTHPYRPNLGRTDGWITSVDFTTSVTVVEKKFFEWCPREYLGHWDAKYRIQEFKNGSTIQFKSADSGRSKFQGQRLRWAWMDEEIPKEIFEEIEARQMPNEPLDIWMTMTPLLGLTWVISEVMEPWQEYQHNLKVKGKVA